MKYLLFYFILISGGPDAGRFLDRWVDGFDTLEACEAAWRIAEKTLSLYNPTGRGIPLIHECVPKGSGK